MKVCLTLLCLFFLKINQEVRGKGHLENLVLQHGVTVGPIYRNEGENITVTCEFGYTGTKRFFCKETCEEENVLIETTEDTDENSRFSIRYEKRSLTESDFLNVSITDLKPSDSGWYRCRTDVTVLGNLFKTQHADFDLVVTEDFSKPKWTTRPLIISTFFPAASTTTTTQSFSPSPSETIKSSDKPAAASDPLLYVGLSLAVLIILLATALLIFCQRKNLHQQKGPPVKKDPTDFTTINTVYEEIREKDRENKPPAGEISSVYAYVQSNKPNAAESNKIYSLASEPQGQAKEEDIEYSEVQLPNGAIRSNGGHLAASDNVTYSEPRLATSSGSHGNGSPPLYSTITLQE